MTLRPRFVHVLAAAPVLVLMLASVPASASERGRAVETRVQVAAPAMNAEAAIAALRAAGYDQIRKLEWEGGVWEARASDAQGRRVQLCVDATSAAVAPCRR